MAMTNHFYVSPPLHPPPHNGQVDQMLLDAQVDDVLEGMMHLRELHDLHVMTINLRYYSDFPRDTEVGRQILAQLAAASPKPDVICVQEGLEGVDPLGSVGYRRLVSSASRARPFRDMVYGSVEALSTLAETRHDYLAVNELYVRDGSAWEVADSGVAPISTDLFLEHVGEDHGAGDDGGAGGEYWPLAIRTVVWAKFRRRAQRPGGPQTRAFVLCTRLSGGGFEDQFFIKQLAEERTMQVERILKVFAGQAGPEDFGVIVGDFGGALPEDTSNKLMGSCLETVLRGPSSQAEADRARVGLRPEELQRRFRAYATAPLAALRARGWHAAPCRGAAHEVSDQDHSGSLPTVYMATNQVISLKPQAVVATTWRRDVWPRACDLGHPDRGIAKATLAVRQPAGDEAKAGSPSVFAADGNAGQHASLQLEHRELVREHRAEQEASEEMQLRLSNEMMELRDSCHEKGQAISTLTCRLAETAEAVTAELQSAAVLRHELEVELAREEAQRRDLEATLGTEESEAANRVQAAEQQLHAMESVRASLEAQIRTSLQIQAELSDHIAAERNGRSELEVAGERELSAWREHNKRVHSEIQDRLEAEKTEVTEWRANTEKQVGRLREESEQHGREEAELMAQLTSYREAQVRDRARLQAEAVLWNHEVEVLNARVLEVDEECRSGDELHQQLNQERAMCASEKEELEEELRECLEQRRVADQDLEICDRSSVELREELKSYKDAVAHFRRDEETERLCQERDEIRKEIRAESEQKAYLEAELAQANRGIFSCFKRRPPPPASAAPLPPPEGPPPKSTKQAGRGQSPARGKDGSGRRNAPKAKGSKPDRRQQQGDGGKAPPPPPPVPSSHRGGPPPPPAARNGARGQAQGSSASSSSGLDPAADRGPGGNIGDHDGDACPRDSEN